MKSNMKNNDFALCNITVMFEQPFWIALFERNCGGRYEACKVTFGAEPKDAEVYDFLLRSYGRLRFSPAIAAEQKISAKTNPKRLQREIAKGLESRAIGTKAQQALKLQHDEDKFRRKAASREQKELEKERLFELKQQKRREKHKGH